MIKRTLCRLMVIVGIWRTVIVLDQCAKNWTGFCEKAGNMTLKHFDRFLGEIYNNEPR